MPDKNITREPDKVPNQEKHRPDLMLQMTPRQVQTAIITSGSFAAAIILAAVFYRLNGHSTAGQAAAPPSAHPAKPSAVGNSGAATPRALPGRG